jgi:hypothetical protein
MFHTAGKPWTESINQTFTFPNVRRNDPFNKILQITIIEAIKQQIPEAVLWRPSRQYLRRKSRDKKREVELSCVTGFPDAYIFYLHLISE